MNAHIMIVSAAAVSGMAGMAMGDVVFQDNFESGLSQWTGKGSGQHHGVLVIDPHNQSNTALSFSGLNSAGDMFTSSVLTLVPETTYRLSFDYMSIPQSRTVLGDSGGYIGFSVGTPSTHSWKWATGSASGASDVLIDDGQWHSYAFDFTSADIGLGSSVRLMLEDFSGSGGQSGDVYFDNITVGTATVPAPGMAAMLGVFGLVTARRRRH